MSKKNIQPSQKHFSKKLIQLKCSLDTKTKSKKKLLIWSLIDIGVKFEMFLRRTALEKKDKMKD